jgi:O-antigen ligase
MLIKYFPQYGRGFSFWTGEAYNNGVALNKNGLGLLCFVLGIALVWNLQVVRSLAKSRQRLEDQLVIVVLLAMLGWLLHMSDSKTALMTLVAGVLVLVLARLPLLRPRFGLWAVLGVLSATLLEWVFDIYATVIRALGRNPNLTDRTEIWADVIALQPNALLGAGFESFWLGDRLTVLWSKWTWHPNQAHSGYIEAYLNGGLIGLVLTLAVLVAAFVQASRQLASKDLREADWGRLRLAFLVAIAVYNYTEATFKGVNVVWTMMFLVAWQAVALPRSAIAPASAAGRVPTTEPAMEPGAVPRPRKFSYRPRFGSAHSRRLYGARRKPSS